MEMQVEHRLTGTLTAVVDDSIAFKAQLLCKAGDYRENMRNNGSIPLCQRTGRGDMLPLLRIFSR